MIQKIDGHKTQVVSVLTLVAGYAVNRGWIDKETADVALSVLAILLTMAITHHEIKAKGGK